MSKFLLWNTNRVSVRIGTGFGVLLILMLCCAGTGYYSLTQMGRIAGFIAGPAWTNADGIMNGVIQTQSQMIAVDHMVKLGVSPQLQDRIRSLGKGADDSFHEVQETRLFSQEKIDRLNRLRIDYKSALNLIVNASLLDEVHVKAFEAASENLLIYIEELESEGDAIVDEASQKVIPLQRSMNYLILFFAIASIVVSVIAASITTQSIVQPVRDIVSALGRFGNGDLGQKIQSCRSDEFGQMANEFNSAASKIHALMFQVRENSRALADAASRIRLNADELSLGVRTTTAQTEKVNSVAVELSNNMSDADHSASDMSKSVGSINSSLHEMTATINEISAVTQKYNHDVTTTSELTIATSSQMQHLLETTNAIGNVVQLIEDLAEQTNLLALNATIEAARAGDSGKGFAVVATEVKELAKQTAEATSNIRQSIETVQSASKDAVASIESINSKIRGMNETTSKIAAAIEEQSISTRSMADYMASANNSVTTVAGSVRHSTEASRQITQSIIEVNRVAKGAAVGASQFVDAGIRLQLISDELDTLVGQFQL